MNLIILHGPPASGKYSIAKELEQLIDASIYHNHLAIDVVKPFFDFGSSEFWRLVDEIRFNCLSAFLRAYPKTVVFTWCYSDPEDRAFFESLEKVAQEAKSNIIPVFLQCSSESLKQRVVNKERGELGKLNDVAGLEACMDKWNLCSIPREDCLVLNTDNKSAKASAIELVERLKVLQTA